jgi:AP-1 complex subunit beta-1
MHHTASLCNSRHAQHSISLDDGISSTQKALQNIAAGQQAENLLDFGDDESRDGQPSGLAATTISATPAAANLLQNSSNPLDDLVSIFGGSGMGGLPSPQKSQGGGLGGLSFGAQPAVPQTMATGHPPTISKPAQPAQGQDDLLGLF